MRWLARLAALFRDLIRRDRLEQELDAELRSFQAMLIDRNLARRLSAEEAQRQARFELESMDSIKEQVRDVRAGALAETIWHDTRYAWRSLARTRGFTMVALITLALGIGINTAVFSVVYAVLLRPLPYDHPEQLALIWTELHKTAPSRAPASGPLLAEIQHRNRQFQDVAAVWVGNGTFTGEISPEQVKVAFVTSNFPALLGFRPELGRAFLPSEEFAGGRPAIMLSYGIWQRRFGGDPAIIGRAVGINRQSATVVGVLPRDFQLRFPADSNVPAEVGAIMPFGEDVRQGPVDLYYLRLLARLKPGVSFAQAQSELNEIAARVRGACTLFAGEDLSFQIRPLHDDWSRDLRAPLVALFAGAGFVLLICCVNMANLLLARGSDRRKEIAVRAALGASRVRILRHLLLEAILLCLIAGFAGAALGWAGVHGLLRLRPDYLARMPGVGLNWFVLAFVAAISFGSVFLFALFPSVESSKFDLNRALRDGGRTSQSAARRDVRSVLIVAEIMLGFVLVIGAGLTIRTLVNILSVNPGFEAERLLTFEIDLSRYSHTARINFVKDWESKLASLPGVESLGGVSHLPLDDYPNWYSPFRPDGVTKDQAAGLLADYRAITPGYLHAMGTKLVAGRFFDEQDRAGGREVVLVDDLLARTVWPGQSAIGKKIEAEHLGERGFTPAWSEVVGVVEHIRNHSLSRIVRGEIYIPYEQTAREHLSFALRTRVDPLSLAGPIRQELRRRDRDLAISKVRPMTVYLERASAPARFTAVLAAIFAGLAFLLAAVGIYGVISYSVSRRMHEMGVRMALGATSLNILALVLREGLTLAAIGIALGAGAALLVSRALQNLIYGVSAFDLLTYGLAIAVVSTAALLGCWRPAANAANANPVDAIRSA